MKIGDIVVLVDAQLSMMPPKHQGKHFEITSLGDERYLSAIIVGDDSLYAYYLKKTCIRPLTPLEKALL